MHHIISFVFITNETEEKIFNRFPKKNIFFGMRKNAYKVSKFSIYSILEYIGCHVKKMFYHKSRVIYSTIKKRNTLEHQYNQGLLE
jgi:hypothetical protein